MKLRLGGGGANHNHMPTICADHDQEMDRYCYDIQSCMKKAGEKTTRHTGQVRMMKCVLKGPGYLLGPSSGRVLPVCPEGTRLSSGSV